MPAGAVGNNITHHRVHRLGLRFLRFATERRDAIYYTAYIFPLNVINTNLVSIYIRWNPLYGLRLSRISRTSYSINAQHFHQRAKWFSGCWSNFLGRHKEDNKRLCPPWFLFSCFVCFVLFFWFDLSRFCIFTSLDCQLLIIIETHASRADSSFFHRLRKGSLPSAKFSSVIPFLETRYTYTKSVWNWMTQDGPSWLAIGPRDFFSPITHAVRHSLFELYIIL